jgi:hypothetical protein
MVDEWIIVKDLEGTDRDLIEALPWRLPRGTEKNKEEPQ